VAEGVIEVSRDTHS